MPHSPGDKLGPYEILSTIGAGGMGEVYKARDTRLDRTVAIKVLPEHIAKREDLRARFEREAHTVASLNHPHICTLHDIGPGYMVMELIEGETLAARLDKGALPLDQALTFATQIADALDRAHRAGVTHRDIKPQNIMLTRDGVKVLDFGLAKSSSKPTPSEATLTAVLTTEGTVMGTPQYMAPEQFEGREADARSDIWAFGAVLYEMVTGQKAFRGKSYSSLVGAILSADPSPMAVKPFTPAWLERSVRRCLAKDPEDRWQSMRDVVLELRNPPALEGMNSAPSRSRLGWITGALAVALLVAGVGWYNAVPSVSPRPLTLLKVEIEPDKPIVRVEAVTGAGGNVLALSPDGTRLAVTLRGADGKVRLHTRLLNQSQFTPLAGTENAYSPFFSPAGDWIGFFTHDSLKKIAVEGGSAVTLCQAAVGYGGSWAGDGSIVAALSFTGTLSRVPSSGGSPVPVTKLGPGETSHRWPHVLPSGDAVLFSVAAEIGTTSYDDANIEVVSLGTGERKTILRGGFFPRYVASPAGPNGTGHLVYLRQTTLFAVPFHPGRLTLHGSPMPIVEDVDSTTVAGGDFASGRNGTFVYLPARVSPGWAISWVDSSGKTPPLHAPPGQYYSPRFSPDGKRLAFMAVTGKGADIWVKDLERETVSRLTFLPGTNSYPVWTADGQTIVFRSTNPAAPGLYAIRSDGSGEARRLSESRPLVFPYSLSPDGKHLIASQSATGGSDLFDLPVDVSSEGGPLGIRFGKPVRYLETPFAERSPQFSPDGRWLAYASNESGILEVYVRLFPGPGGVAQISNGGGRLPLWSRASRELLFQTADSQVMAVSYTVNGDSFAAGKPRLWTNVRLRSGSFMPNSDLARDGKRLAAMVAGDERGEKPLTHLTFLLNFADELRRKAPESH